MAAGATRSLRVRLVASVLLVAVALVGALLFQVLQHRDIARSQRLLTEGYLPLALHVDLLEQDQQRIAADIGRLVRQERRPGTGPASTAAIHSERLREEAATARILADQALRMQPEPAELAVLNKVKVSLQRIEGLVADYQSQVSQVVALREAGADAAELEASLQTGGQALEDEVDALSQLIDARVERLSGAIDVQRSRAVNVAAALTLVGLGLSLGLVLAVLVALRPLDQLTAQVQRLAAGDTTTRIEVRSSDEIGVLAREFDAMVEALQVRDRRLVERAEELNRLSAYLGTVLDSLQDALFVVEGDVVTLANPAATERLGAEVGGRPPPAMVDESPEVWVGPRRYGVRSGPFGEGGRIVVAHDVTEQRDAEERLARSERLALVGQMLAQITHEVRNPLNAMSLNAEMLADELADLDPQRGTEAWDLLGTVSGEIERLTRVTAHYLQLARRPRARLEVTDLVGLVRDVARLVAAELEVEGVDLQLSLDDVPAQRADGGQLRQALLNVLRNATEAGARTLSVQLRADDREVVLAVDDDGPGMSAEQLERAFDPFFSTKASGTGLGLAITRQILEDHDGEVRVSTSRWGGAAMELAMPRRDAGEEA
jgi:signal transduction histidine kinase/HAMP domain-containing protein